MRACWDRGFKGMLFHGQGAALAPLGVALAPHDAGGGARDDFDCVFGRAVRSGFAPQPAVVPDVRTIKHKYV